MRRIKHIMTRSMLLQKARLFITHSIQRLEIFTDLEICTESDNDRAHRIMNQKLKEMETAKLAAMVKRMQEEDRYDSYYEIFFES